MALIFGFDIGTTSIGSAVIRYDEASSNGDILHLGVRIFPEARDPDGTPLNQTRRMKRMMRRQLRRRRARRKALNETLVAAGLLPTFGSADWPKAMAADPYELRKRGLSEPLSPWEIGRALYHIARRRHFRARDLEDTEDAAQEAADEKEAKSNREATLQQLTASGQTLGAWLAGKPAGERKRGVHAVRKSVQDEFDRFWRAQAPHCPAMTDELREAVAGTIFSQRPVFWRRNTLGECRFMPGEELCPRASWLSQQRRMLEKLNNLAFAGGNGRPLDNAERGAILAKLQTQGTMGWPGVRKILEPLLKARGESARTIKFNLEVGGDPSLPGNKLEARLADIFGPLWDRHPYRDALRREVPARLWSSDYGDIGTQRVVIRPEVERKIRRDQARASFIHDFGVTQPDADRLLGLSLESGWEPYSTAALERILPELERGVRFGTLVSGTEPEWERWRAENFPAREQPTGEFHDRLPTPRDRDEARRISQLRNPTVVRCQNELRKVVNNLIAVYGKPDLIRVELARDVGKSKREREEIQSGIRRNEKKRRQAAEDLRSKGIAEPSRADIEKWMLWKEGSERCPYTGDQISFDALFRDNRYQIEHIWPRSRSLDDGFRNKTLCRTDVNIAKGNRTPYEHFKHRGEDWDIIKDRVNRLMGKDGMSPGKVRRFLAESMPDDFASRQLNDTGYAARQAVSLLRKLWPDVGPTAPVTVQPVNGKVTAQLRRRWGLNNILSDDGEKTRADHRHHAVDALAVACAGPAVVKRLSDYFADEERSVKPHLPEPWPSIRLDATAAVAKIIVSHRVRKKVSGPLHKETTYGDTGNDVTTKTGTYRVFVTRKKVEALTKGELADIRDERVRKVVAGWVAAHGGDPKKAFATFPKSGPDGPEIRRVRLTSKQQISLMAPVSTGYADLGANHHIAVYRQPDGTIDYEVISLFEAAGRVSRREPVVRREREGGGQFVMSLSPGDTVWFPDGAMAGYWVVQGAWSNGQIVLVSANDAIGQSTTRPSPGALLSKHGRKITVDPIGRVRPARD